MMDNLSGQPNLRIATFNVHFGKNDTAIAQALQANPKLRDAKIILLQEIEDHKNEGVSRAKKIADALGFEHVYMPSRPVKDIGTHGLAILSKYPLQNVETLNLPSYSLPFRPSSRIALTATADIGGVIWRIANAHLDTRLNSLDRINQLRPVVEHLKKNPREKIILGGDFNILPFRFHWSFPFFYHNQRSRIDEYLTQEGFLNPCEKIGHTFKRGFLKFELDAIYVRNATILECQVERSIHVSDHKPLWVDVSGS